MPPSNLLISFPGFLTKFFNYRVSHIENNLKQQRMSVLRVSKVAYAARSVRIRGKWKKKQTVQERILYAWRNSQRRQMSEVREMCRKYSYLFPYKMELSYTMPQDKKLLTSTLSEIRWFSYEVNSHLNCCVDKFITIFWVAQNKYIGMNSFRWNSDRPSYVK
jgi:hypothetical protein